MVEDDRMVFIGKKSCFGIGALLILTAFVGIQSTGAAAGEPPVALTGGPYESYECNSILFDASGSYDPEGAALLYRWNFDGTWTSWTSMPYAEYMWRDDFSGTISLEVSDGDLVSSATGDVNVMNVPPFILSIDGPANTLKAMSETALTVHCFDGDPRENIASLDTCTAVFSWGDGTSTSYSIDAGVAVVVGSHSYTNAGQYNVTVTLADDDGGTCQASLPIVVNQSSVSVDTLIGIINSLNLKKGLKNNLLSKLENIPRALDHHRIRAVVHQLREFIHFVEGQHRSKLSRDQANQLISTARLIIDSLRMM